MIKVCDCQHVGEWNSKSNPVSPGIRVKTSKKLSSVTLSKVARHAGVSLATASRVLNGSARKPAEDIAARVRTSAEVLGYVPNAQAQGLARSSTGLIGLVVNDIADPYFSSIAKGVQHRAFTEDQQLLLTADEGTGVGPVGAFVAHRTRAIIMAGSRRSQLDPVLVAELSRYQSNGGVVVTIGQSWLDGANAITIDNHKAALDLAQEFIEENQRRFAFFGGPEDIVTAGDRRRGFELAMSNAGITAEAVTVNDFSTLGGYDAASRLVQSLGTDGARGLLVIAANDVMAVGAIAGFRDYGLEVPHDLCVAGFGDIPISRHYSPSLTTMRFPLESIGELAADIALGADAPRTENITGELIRRESA